jgi:hypothetical protein
MTTRTASPAESSIADLAASGPRRGAIVTPLPGAWGSDVSWWWCPTGRPNPLALPSDLALRFQAAGLPVLLGTHAEGCAACRGSVAAEEAAAERARGAAADGQGQFGLFANTEAA